MATIDGDEAVRERGPRSGTHSSGRPAQAGAEMADLAIIGGGFSGVATAIHLLRRPGPPASIAIVEPRDRLGEGVAYGTTDPTHRINVPATRMSVVADDTMHFRRWLDADTWLADDPDAVRPDGAVFVARKVFGTYLAATLTEVAARGGGAVRQVRAAADAVAPGPNGQIVRLQDGTELRARAVVLAVTHPPPSMPTAFQAVAEHPALVPNAYGAARPNTYAATLPIATANQRVLIVGTGLTMADVVASLEAGGHVGPILAVSRRGLLSRGHSVETGAPDWPPLERVPHTALGLLRAVRAEVAVAARAGRSWHGVLDAVRRQAPELWAALPTAERRRVVARLRPFWDVHRFRIAPQPEAAIARLRGAGQLEVRPAHIAGVAADGAVLRVRFAGRGRSWWQDFDRVVLATGPDHAGAPRQNPALASLAAAGLLRPDPCALGIDVDAANRVLDREGQPVPGLFVAGPLARGRHGELMGLPEVARHAEAVADAVAEWLAASPISAAA